MMLHHRNDSEKWDITAKTSNYLKQEEKPRTHQNKKNKKNTHAINQVMMRLFSFKYSNQGYRLQKFYKL